MELISVLFIIFVAVYAIKQKNKKVTESDIVLKKASSKARTTTKVPSKPITVTSMTSRPANKLDNSPKSLMDDKENDWLANQLREEHRAFKRTSQMFGLKIEHVSHCDARYIRNEHAKHCDANKIDNAVGK